MTIDEQTRALLKEQCAKMATGFDGAVVRFYADQACRQQVGLVVLQTPAFEIGDDIIPRVRPQVRGYGAATHDATITHARIGAAKGIPVFKSDGIDDKPNVIYLTDTSTQTGSRIEIASFFIAIKINHGEQAVAAVANARDNPAEKCAGVAVVLRKADKDAAFETSRSLLPGDVSDEAIRGLTEHGATWEAAVKELAPAEDIPNAEWLDPDEAAARTTTEDTEENDG